MFHFLGDKSIMIPKIERQIWVTDPGTSLSKESIRQDMRAYISAVTEEAKKAYLVIILDRCITAIIQYFCKVLAAWRFLTQNTNLPLCYDYSALTTVRHIYISRRQ